MIKHIRRIAVLWVVPVLLVLGACETAPKSQPFPEIHFTHLAPIDLNVASVDVVMHYTPPFAAPNVDHLFPLPPRNVLARWGEERLRAVGASGRARFIVMNAAVVESKIEKETEGFYGLIRTEEAERYDGTVEARLEIYDASNTRMAFASASANQFQTVLEDASPNERKQAWFDLLSTMMKTFDGQMDAAIRGQLGGVVK